METRFLQTFLTVAETNSLAETARRLNITPSAVVQRIRALESEIGYPLVRRAGHSMQLTEAGASIFSDANRIVALERDLKAAASINRTAGLLRIGVIHSVLTGMLPDLLVALKQEYPDIELYILPGMSNDLYTSVIQDNLDAAIIVRPHFALPKKLDWALIRREPIILIAPPEESNDSARQIIKAEPFIRYDRNHWGGRIVDQYLQRMKFRPHEQYELDSLEAITLLVSRGVGVSLIPDWLQPWPKGADVRRITPPRAPTRDIGVLWIKDSSRLALIQALLKTISMGWMAEKNTSELRLAKKRNSDKNP